MGYLDIDMLLMNLSLEPGKQRVLSLPLPSPYHLKGGRLCYHSSEKEIARAPDTSSLVRMKRSHQCGSGPVRIPTGSITE